jgi:DNA invertase Pin-like site-specific DNA recombinase/predicted RNase H-like HicB family nuclease
MSALLVGYARVSTHDQDLTAQRNALAILGVSAERTYVDHGLTGTNRERPGLREALAARRSGDTLVVTKLDRLARSLPDAREILEDLTRREVKLSIGGSVHDPTDPVGRLLFNVLAMVAEFESDVIRLRTRRAYASRRPRGACGAASPSSIRARKRTSSRCTAPASTAPRSLATSVFTPDEDGWTMPQLAEWPAVVTCGRTVEEARAMLLDAAREMIASYRDQGREPPIGGGHVEQLTSDVATA